MSSRAYCVAAAVAFLIAGSGMASAEVEDIPPAAASPDEIAQDSGLFRKADAFGIEGATPLRRPWGSTFTSLSVGGKIVSSPRCWTAARRARRIARALFFKHARRPFPDDGNGLRACQFAGPE
jgi:hypothetical protein